MKNAIVECVRYGYELVALANPFPPKAVSDEADSFLYRSAARMAMAVQAEWFGKPPLDRRRCPCPTEHDGEPTSNHGGCNNKKGNRRRTSRLVLLGLSLFAGGITTLLLYKAGWESAGGETNSPKNFEQPVLQLGEEEPRRCWVFNHMNKAGGSTIKYMLSPWVEERDDVSVGLYDSLQWLKGGEYAREFLEERNTLTWGAYAEGLRPYGGGQECKWFTIFRHPIPRLVSAYFYCKKSPVDGLCASMIVNADDVDLYTFAEHWGNYGLRQFTLAYALPEDVLNFEADGEKTCAPQEGRRECPGWYWLKLYLEGLHEKAEAGGGEGKVAGRASLLPLLSESAQTTPDTEDAAMRSLIQPVSELPQLRLARGTQQSDKYLPFLVNSLEIKLLGSRQAGFKNGNSFFEQLEIDTLETTWTDPELKKHILLDLVLYDQAVSVHSRQLAKYGLQ
ncbi:unnamed protein product [Pylaiella littoralis]